MAFDGIVVKSVVSELNTCLINGKINKVYQPNKNEVLLGIYSNGKNYALNISIDSSNYRVHLTTNSKPNPMSPYNFCMFLRKHLIGMTIKNISSYDLERIITIHLEGFNELNDLVSKKLIIELMGKHSNIILTNSNNIIIDSLRHLAQYSNSLRDISPAHEYSYPINQKISFLNLSSFEEFYTLIKDDLETDNISNIMASKFIGFSNGFINYTLEFLNIPISSKDKLQLNTLYNYIKDVLTKPVSLVSYELPEKKKLDYTVSLTKSSSPLCVNFFLDDYYKEKESSEEFKNYRNNILKLILNELNKYTKRLNSINLKLNECAQMSQFKLYGELITSNLYRFNNENLSEIEVENYYDNNNLIKIPLDKTISISNNAKKYFKKYNKLKNALSIVSIQKAETSEEIDYLESIVYELENAKTLLDINEIYSEISEHVIFKNKLSNNTKKNNKKSKSTKNTEDFTPIHFCIDSFDVYIGKNNKQNDYLTMKFAHNNDLWFHTKDIHGSHVILKTNGTEVEQSTINKCASIAAYYSKAKNSSNVAVDYTFVRYVKKPSGAKPGKVIYTNYQTVNVNPNNNF